MPKTSVEDVLERLRKLVRPGGRDGMARFGINPEKALGVRMPDIRRLAKELGRDHSLALALWRTDVHEARILASLVDEPDRVTERQMESWVRGFDSWDVCDQVCGNLFDRTQFAAKKTVEWMGRDEVFVKRAGFALAAWRAVHDRAAADSEFAQLLPLIEREAHDPRNFVKKAVSWALRQIGKRNRSLNARAVVVARRLSKREDSTARWVGKDALRELTSHAVRGRLG